MKSKYLFILGRNVELSVAELKAFFEREKIMFKIVKKIHNGVMIEADSIKGEILERLGGTISIGEVLAEGTLKEIEKELENKMLYDGKSNKLNYVVFDFHGKGYIDVLLYLKQRFKEEKLKATEKKLTGKIKLQSGELVQNLSSNLVKEQYFVFENCFGRIIQTCDYNEIEKRDMQKPVRRNELSISPRLAKILINLSKVKENETLLDPFCGIGTIMQEALLQNIKAVGIDIDETAVDNAKINLDWFKFPEQNYKLLKGDSSKMKIPNANGIASEPDLGTLQKKLPSFEKAKEQVAEFEKLMIKVINNLKENVSGRIVFTCPLVKTEKMKISSNFQNIASQTKMKIASGFPIDEFREDSIVGRSIIVLEK